jgi:RND family efflux transporter MFP subunit
LKNTILFKSKISILAAVLIFVMISACSSDSSNSENSPGDFRQFRDGQVTSVEAVPVQTSTISDQIRSFGTIRAQDVVNVNPQVSNRITKIHADLGDSVQQGDILAKIYDVPFRDELEQVQAQLQQARINFERDSTQFERQKTLFENEVISQLEYEEAKATFQNSRSQVESARAALTQSRENLENTEIRSPVNGVVLNRLVAEGDIATTGTTAFEIANLVGYETRLYLPMQDWVEVRVGLPVELRLSNHEGVVGRGNVSRISPQLNPETGLGEVVVSLTDVTSSIRQGVLTESRITLVTNENSVVIPRSALVEKVDTYIEPETNTVEIRRTYSVFVSKGDSVAERRDLTLGLEQGDRVEVLSGISPDEKLIITGNRSLNDGSRIRVAGQSGPGSPERGIITDDTDSDIENSERIQRVRDSRQEGSGDTASRGNLSQRQNQSEN